MYMPMILLYIIKLVFIINAFQEMCHFLVV